MIRFPGDIIAGYVYGMVSLELNISAHEYCFPSVNGRDST